MNLVKIAGSGKPGPLGARRVLRLAVLLSVCSSGVLSQTRQQTPVPQSELARQNMTHVAASTGQLIAILHRDPGLMVELKRWIAKDATDHGQLIADPDLTDEAIFARLETDVTFRSVATRLVQKYGYLQPTVNPQSPRAKQQELLMRERIKWVAQDEEAERARARQAQGRGLQQTQTCDTPDGNCANRTVTSPSLQQPQEQPGMNPLPGPAPDFQTPSEPYAPSQPTAPTDTTTPLLRTSGQDPLMMEELQGESGSLPSGQDFEAGLQNGQRGRGSLGRMQEQVGGTDGNQLADLTLSSDFAGDSAMEEANASPNVANGIPGMNAASGPSGEMPNKGAMRANLREARESSSPNQRLVRRSNPYAEIPSLFDMYLQAAPRPPAVKRFGMQVFENGTRDLQSIPMDLPVGPEYVLGPGDGVSVDLWGGVAHRFYRVVDREGRISLPEVGPVLVAGKSLADAQESVQKTLRTQFRDISADLSLSRLRTIRVYVVGDVLRPGAYDIGSLSTPLNALFA